jgi:hypothetical protein
MLNISQLLKSTFPNFKKSAAYVDLNKIRVGTNKAGFAKIMATASSKVDANGKRKSGIQQHVCAITSLDKNKGFKGPVKTSCDCEAFVYTCEVALHNQGAADIIYSNGEAPDVKNPRMIPTLCKHLYALAQQVKTSGY